MKNLLAGGGILVSKGFGNANCCVGQQAAAVFPSTDMHHAGTTICRNRARLLFLLP